MPVVLVGTLDTKGLELAFVRELVRQGGLETLVIDAGSVGPPAFTPDIDRRAVFQALAEVSLQVLDEMVKRKTLVAFRLIWGTPGTLEKR